MMNPIMQMLNMAVQGQGQGKSQNNNIIAQFLQFAQGFNGNPQQKLNELVNSGKFTQEQINQATQQAKQIEPLIRQFLK